MTIEAIHLTKDFGKPPLRVLHQLDFTIGEGEFIAISGRSGSGKSTLLYLLSSLDFPRSGSVKIDGKDTKELSVAEIHELRNQEIGFVFQFHYLLPELSAIENITLPARRTGQNKAKRDYALDLLKSFGMEGKEHKKPSQLSGGEQQRVAIARALIMEPKYIFADEPTGNLDTRNGMIIMNILKKAHRERHATVVLVTHEPDFAAMAEKEIYLIDGKISDRQKDSLNL